MLSGRIGKTWLGPSPADPSPGRNPASISDHVRVRRRGNVGQCRRYRDCAPFLRDVTARSFRRRPAEEDRFCSLFRLAIGKGWAREPHSSPAGPAASGARPRCPCAGRGERGRDLAVVRERACQAAPHRRADDIDRQAARRRRDRDVTGLQDLLAQPRAIRRAAGLRLVGLDQYRRARRALAGAGALPGFRPAIPSAMSARS